MSNKKVALVLAGGGVVGVAFGVGVLRAINQVWLDRTVNDLDMYVGTSAGSYLAAYLASGITASRLDQFLEDETRLLSSGGPATTFYPNWSEVAEKALLWPLPLLTAARVTMRTGDARRGLLRALEEWLPSGLFDTWLMQRHLYRMYRRYGYGNRFAKLPHDLHIIATDLDSGERAIFNRDNDVPLEKAVAASCALPLLYRPVRIRGRDYVDGGVRGTASIDLAVESGADLVIVINSMVPFQNDPATPGERVSVGEPTGHTSARGPLAITSQISRASIHGGLLYHIKQLKRQHPNVNLMLIEPPTHDPTVSFRNMMTYWQLPEIADYGQEIGLDFWRRNETRARDVLGQRDIRLATRLPESVMARAG